MAIQTPPYLQWRDGRPRWEPGPGLRPTWKGRDLKNEHGEWLGLEAAIAAAEAINRDVAAWRATGAAPASAPAPLQHSRTLAALAEKYYASADFKLLAPNTQAGYRNKIQLFLATEFGNAHVRALTKPQMLGYWQQCYDERGHAMANAIKACVSAMLTYGELIGWRSEDTNPCHDLRRPKLPPRVAIWTPDKVEALVAVADATGVPEIGDAVVIGLHTAQRLGDVLDMPLRILLGQRVQLTQMKRKALIDSPMTPALKRRVAAMKERHAARAVVGLDAKAVVDITGAGYDPSRFNKAFRAVRATTLEKHDDLDRAQRFAPGLASLTYQDLRDTAITRLAMAGCTLPQIAAISGHSAAHITSVIKHYLALDVQLADDAIARLTHWLETNRIAI